jgi:hypothetical protein
VLLNEVLEIDSTLMGLGVIWSLEGLVPLYRMCLSRSRRPRSSKPAAGCEGNTMRVKRSAFAINVIGHTLSTQTLSSKHFSLALKHNTGMLTTSLPKKS